MRSIVSFVVRWLQVAAYDFIIPVVINQTGAPTPAATPLSTHTSAHKQEQWQQCAAHYPASAGAC